MPDNPFDTLSKLNSAVDRVLRKLNVRRVHSAYAPAESNGQFNAMMLHIQVPPEALMTEDQQDSKSIDDQFEALVAGMTDKVSEARQKLEEEADKTLDDFD